MEIQTKKGKVVLYDSIDELTFERFNAFNKYVMIESELGSSVSAFDKTILRVLEFVRKDMKEEAEKEIINIRQTYHNILEMNSPIGLSFACLVKSIDGKRVEEFNGNSISATLEKLKEMGLTMENVQNGTVQVKKKSKPN